MSKMILLIALICCSPKAFAIAGGVGVSDGGHGVVCHVPTGLTVRFLDSLEAESNTGVERSDLEHSFGFVGEHFYDHLDFASSMLVLHAIEALGPDHPFIPKLREEMRFIGASFSMSLSAPDAFTGFKNTYDYGQLDIVVQPNCSIVQLAVRTREHAISRVVTNAYFWSQLTEFDKFGLMVHESLHGWFAPEDSTKVVRQATMFLLANDAFRAAHREAFKALVDTKHVQSFH